MRKKGKNVTWRYLWSTPVCHWVETAINSIVTISRGNFRHACISVYNLRASLSSAALHRCNVDQIEGYVARSRSGGRALYRKIFSSRAYKHHTLVNHVLAFTRDIPTCPFHPQRMLRFVVRLSYDRTQTSETSEETQICTCILLKTSKNSKCIVRGLQLHLMIKWSRLVPNVEYWDMRNVMFQTLFKPMTLDSYLTISAKRDYLVNCLK